MVAFSLRHYPQCMSKDDQKTHGSQRQTTESRPNAKRWNRRNWIGSALLLVGSLPFVRSFGARKIGTRGTRVKGATMKSNTNGTLKAVSHLLRPQEQHWVGDGFYVSTILSPSQLDPQLLSPFVLMDHAAPRHFEPSTHRRGVGEHPHRGFETVTFAYSGEVEHRDSAGGGGKIGPGDVQWMTAASGVVHEEKHSSEFSASGGIFEMVQLWVNLPAKLKMSEPRYQTLRRDQFATVRVGDAQGRLIAGRFSGKEGPAKTHSPVTLFDLKFDDDGTAMFDVEDGTTTLLFVLKGSLVAQEGTNVSARDLVVFDRDSSGSVRLVAKADTQVLVLNGEPLNEPVVAHGPFVMNTREEIVQAMYDYQTGKMGHLDSRS